MNQSASPPQRTLFRLGSGAPSIERLQTEEARMSERRVKPTVPSPAPAPQGRVFYLRQAEACLAAAAHTTDAGARRLHEEECRLWLMLARQRQAIDVVVQNYVEASAA
jgi:hypothetical protein